MSAVPGVRFLPNAITALALSIGLTSVVFASQGKWLLAMIMIAISTVLDSLDGPAARLLNSSSRIGAELDSLSDLSAFGFCPAVLIYFWQSSVNDVGRYLWLVWGSCLVYAVCTALRLARFNSLLEDPHPKPFQKAFFTGVPSPPGALLAIAPIIAYTEFGEVFFTQLWVVALWTIMSGLLMVSTLPTIALKSIRMPPQLIVPAIIVLVFALVAFVFQPQIVTLIGLAIYLAHIPYSAWRYNYLSQHPELWNVRRERRERGVGRRLVRQPRLRVRAGRRAARVAGLTIDGSPTARGGEQRARRAPTRRSGRGRPDS